MIVSDEIVDAEFEPSASSALPLIAETEPGPSHQLLEHNKLVKSVRRKLLNVQDVVNTPNKMSTAGYEVGILISLQQLPFHNNLEASVTFRLCN